MNESAVLTELLTEAEVREFAEAWYRKLDVHAPAESYRPLMTEDVEFVFPEANLKGFAAFTDWYEGVTRIYFDEVHVVKAATLTSVSAEKADVQVVVKWEASIWNAPEPCSQRIVLDAYQTWVVKRSPTTGKPVIATYLVNDFKYHEGSFIL